MTTATIFPQATDISANDYCAFGLATCFLKEDGEFRQVEIFEPIPSAAIAAILQGIPTSYQLICAKNIGDIISGDRVQIPAEFPANALISDNFTERAIAAVRTYKNRPEAKDLVPLGTIKEDLNYSLEKKRVLNATNVVSAEDNVKQHSHTHKVL
ncbi:MAG: hypothetical protein ACFBSE_19240 [Prochloraceae cyanobacterium]